VYLLHKAIGHNRHREIALILIFDNEFFGCIILDESGKISLIV
jgi:hypothetical protein